MEQTPSRVAEAADTTATRSTRSTQSSRRGAAPVQPAVGAGTAGKRAADSTQQPGGARKAKRTRGRPAKDAAQTQKKVQAAEAKERKKERDKVKADKAKKVAEKAALKEAKKAEEAARERAAKEPRTFASTSLSIAVGAWGGEQSIHTASIPGFTNKLISDGNCDPYPDMVPSSIQALARILGSQAKELATTAGYDFDNRAALTLYIMGSTDSGTRKRPSPQSVTLLTSDDQLKEYIKEERGDGLVGNGKYKRSGKLFFGVMLKQKQSDLAQRPAGSAASGGASASSVATRQNAEPPAPLQAKIAIRQPIFMEMGKLVSLGDTGKETTAPLCMESEYSSVRSESGMLEKAHETFDALVKQHKVDHLFNLDGMLFLMSKGRKGSVIELTSSTAIDGSGSLREWMESLRQSRYAIFTCLIARSAIDLLCHCIGSVKENYQRVPWNVFFFTQIWQPSIRGAAPCEASEQKPSSCQASG